jgi:hypothetical protein
MFKMALVIFVATVTAWAQDEDWSKVRQVESGTDLRVYKKGQKKPISGKMTEANDGNLVVSVKNGQESVTRDQIERD